MSLNISNVGSTEQIPYEVGQKYHSQGEKLRVVNVGAGAAGLLVAYKMKKNFKNYELICYEKNPHIAGTWYENRYPGCACDIPAHVYTYPFEPNPTWSSFYASGPEIRQYFERFAAKYDLLPFVALNSRVLEANWVEEKGIYELVVDIAGTKSKDWCHVLINGTGFLNHWKWPAIPGLHTFGGHLMHSANWDPSVEYAGKVVAVIGTGSSAIQIIPQLQKVAKQLICVMRSVTWISPPVAEEILNEEKQASHNEKTPSNAQYHYSDEEKQRFQDDPEHLLQYRQKIEQNFNAGFDLYLRDSEMSKSAQKSMRTEMLRRLGPGHEELKKKLIPSWPPGCKRVTPGDGYLEALVAQNTITIHKEIHSVVSEGIIDEDGVLYKVDIIVCATGFNLAFTPLL